MAGRRQIVDGKAEAEFSFLQEVGRGSYGVVNKVCVIKSVRLELLGTDRERTLALNEAKIMKDLSCPHILEYFDAFIERGTLYLVLEYCELGNLKAMYLSPSDSLAERKIWRIGLRIAMGLGYLHERCILHRDIKSENILLMPEDGVRIADLGLAKQLSSNKVGASTICGTPRYLSPEMARGLGMYSEKCDIWALGVVFYEMCSANHGGPFTSTSLPDLLHKIQYEDVPPLPRRTDPQLRGLVLDRLLEKEPAVRPRAAEVLALPSVVECGRRHGVLEPPQLQVPPRSPPQAPGRPRSGSSSGAGGQQDRPGSRGSQQDAPEGSLGPEVPDGICSRIRRCLGCQACDDPALGPRFHRFGQCELCRAQGLSRGVFGHFRRRHHCRSCGRSVCAAHSSKRRALPHFGHVGPQRICDLCSLLPVPGGTEAGEEPPDGARPWILTAGSSSQALAWDSRTLSAASWAVGGKLFWMGHGRDHAGPVVLTLGTQAGACLETRALEDGKLLRWTPLPRAAGSHSALTAGSGSLLPPGQSMGSRLSRAANIDAAACCGIWFAVARRDWPGPSVIHVLGLTTGSCIGSCTLQEKVTAMAVQDGHCGFVAAGLHSGEVCVWDIPGMGELSNPRCVLEGHKQPVTCIAVASANGVICTGSSGSLKLWRRQQSTGNFAESEHPEACDSFAATGGAAISCSGSLLAFVSKPLPRTWEKGVQLWDLSPGSLSCSCYKRGHSVGCVALCGALLATSEAQPPRGGCTVQLWYAYTATPLAVFRNPCPVNQLLLVDTQPAKASSRVRRPPQGDYQ